MKTLVLIRHAHRDTSNRAADNGLSAKGRAQAERLLQYFLKTFPPEEGIVPRVVSSPKRRCLQTVERIAVSAHARLELDPGLGERREEESEAEFARRIKRVIDRWLHADEPLVVLCSHGDWLPVALRTVTGARATLKKGGWAEIIETESGELELRWLLQNFRRSRGRCRR